MSAAHRPSVVLLVLAAAISVVLAAEPPDLINFQGVLRDDLGNPLDGPQEMVFHLYDAAGDASCNGGALLLSDRHTGTDTVEVTDGLFSVQIGSGSIAPGAASSLSEVFRDYAGVYLEVEVDREHLCPRTRVVSAGYALNAAKLAGQDPSHFLDTSATPQTKIGSLTLDPGSGSSYGITAYGDSGGGYFVDSNSSGYGYVGAADYGMQGYGELGGGYFQDTNSTGLAHVAYGDLGISAHGDIAGGRFQDSTGTGMAEVGKDNLGIRAEGSLAGGQFLDDDGSNWAWVGYDSLLGDYGIYASGETAGGYFRDATESGTARLAYGDVGIHATGEDLAGSFENTINPDSRAELADSGVGVAGWGWDAGGEFRASELETRLAVGWVGYGVGQEHLAFRGIGTGGGARLDDDDSGTYSYIATGGNSISGNGAKNFVQNHPERSDRVIVYTALEGDEAGTYTRGRARLDDGHARVVLGETFRWVTNPDIGLTAHLTVRGEPIPVAVESLTTEELIVRGPRGSNAIFDFIVLGLRIGFEEASVVQEKRVESFIPSMAEHRERLAHQPDLRRFVPLERFKRMATEIGDHVPLDLSQAAALRAAVAEYSEEIHGPVWSLLGSGLEALDSRARSTIPGRHPGEDDLTAAVNRRAADEAAVTDSPNAGSDSEYGSVITGPTRETQADVTQQLQLAVSMPVSGPVEPGDVLAFDPDRPGSLRLATEAADSRVVGVAVATGEASSQSRAAAVAMTGLVRCKVDAGYSAIRVGDLLTTSPTPGHAMRGLAADPGTVLGKAAAPLEFGTGTIEILVMPR